MNNNTNRTQWNIPINDLVWETHNIEYCYGGMSWGTACQLPMSRAETIWFVPIAIAIQPITIMIWSWSQHNQFWSQSWRDRLWSQLWHDGLGSQHDRLWLRRNRLQSWRDRLWSWCDRLQSRRDRLQSRRDRLQSRRDRLQSQRNRFIRRDGNILFHA